MGLPVRMQGETLRISLKSFGYQISDFIDQLPSSFLSAGGATQCDLLDNHRCVPLS